MLMLMGPWVVAFPIARKPESTLAVVLSFVPPVNAFVMMVRLASRTPPPALAGAAVARHRVRHGVCAPSGSRRRSSGSAC